MSAEFVLVCHFVWAVWMVAGVVVALAGFAWPRVWGWRVFRILHVIGLVGTASVPLWARAGLCPLTLWEWELSGGGDAGPRPLLVRVLSDMLYFDVNPAVLSAVTVLAALTTVALFIMHPPWRYARR